MELYRDLMFKRNLHGYVEETQVQVYKAYLRQVPLWIVYHPQNGEQDGRNVERYGLYFLTGDSVIDYFNAFKKAWSTDGDYIPSIDLCNEVVESVRDAKPEPGSLMYRVIYRCPGADIPECAMGHAPFDVNHPWFVSSQPSADGIGRWCVYPENLALVLVKMLSLTPFGGYVHDRVRDNPDGGKFIVQSTPYDASGNASEFEVWTDVTETDHWNHRVILDFNADMSKIITTYDVEQ